MVEQSEVAVVPDSTAPGSTAPAITRVPVSFHGDGTGAGELTWGQRDLWQIMQEKGSWLPIGTVLPLPAGKTVEDAAADLRFVMSHYPSMRTRLRFGPDGPQQVVAGSGELPLEVVDVADDADPAEVAEEVWSRLTERDYDFATDWPVRMAVLRHRGVLTHRVWVMCHLATDGGGARVIVTDLAERDTTAAEPPASPPLAQATWQSSAAGQRLCAAAMRHWEGILRRVPPHRFPDRVVAEPGPRFWQGRFTSPALLLAARAISTRTGVEVPSVLLAIFAVTLARRTGINPVVVQLTVGNRFRPGLARTVSPIMQNGLCAIDVPDGTVDDAVLHTRRRALTTYKNAYYDPRRRQELIARVNRDRAEPVDLSCFFNDRRLKHRDVPVPAPTPEQVVAATTQHHFEWRHKQDYRRFDKLYVNVDDIPDTVRMTVMCDTHFVAPTEVEGCVLGMQEVAVAAALDPDTRTLAPPQWSVR